MTRVLTEPFDDFTTNSWSISGGGTTLPTIVSARTGTGARIITASTNNGSARYSIAGGSQSADLVIGFAWKCDDFSSTPKIVQLYADSDGTEHSRLTVNSSSGDLAYSRGGSLIGYTGATDVAINTWYYIEMAVRLGDSTAGSFEVKVNGVTKLSDAATDTKNGGTATVFDTVRLGPNTTFGSPISLYDDLYLNTGSLAFDGDPVSPDGEAEPQALELGVEVPHRDPLLTEPFDDFSNWTTSGSPTPAIVAGLDGTAARLQNSGGNTGVAAYTISAEKSTVVVGAYWQIDDFSADPHVFEFRSDGGSTLHCHVNARSDGSLGFLVGGALIDFSSAGSITANTWTLVEAKVRLGDGTSGSYEVRINGVTVMSDTTADTRNGGTEAVFDTITLATRTLGTITALYDVLYIDTGTSAKFSSDVAIVETSGGANTTPSAIARSAVTPTPQATGNFPLYRGNGTTVYWNNSSATQSVANPVGTAVGDLLIMVWTYYASFGTGGVLSNPSGWTLDHTITGAGSPVPSFKIFHRIADLSSTDNPSLVPSAGMYGAVAKFGIYNVDTTAPIHTDATPVNSFASGNVVGPALTATRAQMGLSIAVHAAGTGFPWTSPSPGTERLNNEGDYGSFQVVSQSGVSGDLGTVTHNESFATVTRIVFGLLIDSPNPDGTATPAAVALTVVTPAPTATGGTAGDATATPTAVARSVVTSAPTASGNANTTPAAVARSAVTPAPTASGTSSIATPAAITRTVVVPAPTATGEQGTATPATIARTVTVPTPSASGSHVFATTIARSVTVPTPFVTGTFPAGTYIPVGRVRLFDRTGTTLVATLESAFDIEWQDVDNGTGIGKFNLALSDPDSLLITLGQVVYCDLYDRSNVFSFIVEQYPQARIQSQEELGQVMSISGRGSAAILDTALCYPFDGVDAVPVRTVRSFSFASQDYVETVDWHGATAIAQQGDMTTYWVMTMPETTHLMSAPGAWPNLPIIPYWIWSQDDNSEIGKSYFRETFTTAEAANIEIIATGDNYWTLYLDGVPILGDNEFQEAWQEHRSVSMLLPAGDHTVAAVVNNVFVPLIVGNPGGFLMAILIPHEGQEVDPDLMLLSDTGWNALAYPAAEPGFTPGGIVLSLLTEAQGRSLLTAVTCSFTATHDSAGIAWETIPEFGVNIGASLLTTLESLTNDGWIEWAMTPSGWVLQMWAPGNRGVAAGVTFTEAVNIGEATYEPAHTIVNRLLVSYGKGLFVSEPASALASQAVWGIHEGFLTLDTDDASEASRLALKSIATSMDDELAVTMRIEPDGASPDRPYVNFVVGDQVTGPNELGTPRSYQVLGITITLDLMGDPEISLEMNRRVRNPEEVRVNLLQTLGSAVQGTAPGSRSVVFENDGPYYRTRTPTAGDVKAAGPPAPGEVVFTVPGVVDLTGTSPRWVTPYRFLIYQVIMAVTTVSSGEGGITVRVLGQDFTLPDGQESILIDCELHRDNANSFTVALTDVGGGDATGLTVTLRYRYYTGPL